MRIEHELTIDRPVDVVWDLTLAVESWPSITPTMTSVERLDDGPLRLGSSALVKQPGQRPAVWTVTALEPGELFEWETKVFGVRMVGGHHLSPADGGCRNHLTLDLSGRGAGLLGKLVGGRIRKAITTENEGFKRVAEAR